MSNSAQELTVKLTTKTDTAGVTKLASAVKTVVDQTEAAMKKVASVDPFAKLAGTSVEARLRKTQKSLEDIASGSAMLKDTLRNTFGVSGADKQFARSLQVATDRINDLKRAAANFKLDGNETPLINKMRRIEMEVKKIKSAANTMVSASVSNMSGAMSGGGQVASGLSMLASGKNMEQVVTTMLQYQALFMVIGGGSAVLKGFVGGAINAANALHAMAQAAALARAMTAAGGIGGGPTTLGTGLRFGAGAMAGGVLGQAAGLGPIGTGVSALAGGAAMHFMPAISAGVALPATIAAIAAGSIAVQSSSGLQNLLAPVADHIPNFIPGRGTVDLRQLNLAASAARLLATQTHLNHNRQLRAQFGTSLEALDNMPEFNIRSQFAGQQRDLARNFDVTLATQGASANAAMFGGTHERLLGRTLTGFNEAMANTSRDDATGATFARARAESARVAALAAIGGQGSAAVRARLAGAQTGQGMAQSEFDTINARALTARANQATGNLDEHQIVELEKQRGDAAKRLLEANQQLVSAQREQREQALATLQTEQQRYQEAQKFHRDQARAIRDQQRSSASAFGLMDEDSQLRALDIGKRLQRGESLDRDDIGFAGGIEPLRGMMGSLGRDQAARGGILAQLEGMARPGDLTRNQQAEMHEAEAQRNQNIAIQLEQKLQVEARINAESITADLNDAVLPAIQEMARDLRQQLLNALSDNNLARVLRQFQGANNPPAP